MKPSTRTRIARAAFLAVLGLTKVASAEPTIEVALNNEGVLAVTLRGAAASGLHRSFESAQNTACYALGAQSDFDEKLRARDAALLASKKATTGAPTPESQVADAALKIAESELVSARDALETAAWCVANLGSRWDPRGPSLVPALPQPGVNYRNVDPFWKSLFDGGSVWYEHEGTAIQVKVERGSLPTRLPSGQVLADPSKNGSMVLAVSDGWLLKQALTSTQSFECVFRVADGAGGHKDITECEAIVGSSTDAAVLTFRGRSDLGVVENVKLVKPGKPKEVLQDFPAADCRFAVEGPIGQLIPGASRQMLQVGSLNCSGTLRSVSGVTLTNGADQLHAELVDWDGGASSRLRFSNISPTLTPGLRSWEIRTGHGEYLGKVDLIVSAERLAVETDDKGNPRLSVRYSANNEEKTPGRTIPDWHSGHSAEGYAVVTRTSGQSEVYVTNGPLWKPLPGAIETPSSFLPKDGAAVCGGVPVNFTEEEIGAFLECERRARPWKVTPLTWLTERNIQLGCGSDVWSSDAVGLESLAKMHFATMVPWSNDFVVEVSLRDVSAYGAEELFEPIEWFAARVVVAKGARMESVPIPIAHALHVECGEGENAYDNESRGVNGHKIQAGECKLKYDRRRLYLEEADAAEKARQRWDGLKERARAAAELEAEANARAPSHGVPPPARGPEGPAQRAYRSILAFEQASAFKDEVEEKLSDAIDEYNALYVLRQPTKDNATLLALLKAKGKVKATRLKFVSASSDSEGKLESLDESLQKAWADWEQSEAAVGGREEVLKLVGRQDLIVTVSREGTPAKAFSWRLDPALDQDIAIPGLETKNAVGPYIVEAELNNVTAPRVTWRPPPPPDAPKTSDSSAVPIAGTDLKFRAQLRPRVRGALSNSWRAFATIPIDPIGIRFPARPSEMASSQDFNAVQLARVRTGIAVAFQPWNFDTGEPHFHGITDIPIRFELGMYLLAVQDKAFDPSIFGGIKFTLPLLDLPDGQAKDQLGTDATLGLLVEVPLDYPDAYFLLTIGLDVFTLLGSK